MVAKRGLYANIHAKRKRIAAGSGEKMRKPGSGAPTKANFTRSAKTAKRKSNTHMKSIIASGLLLGMAHGAAIAGPYVNVENNAGFTGSDFTSQVPTSMSVMSLKVHSVLGESKAVLLLSSLMVANRTPC